MTFPTPAGWNLQNRGSILVLQNNCISTSDAAVEALQRPQVLEKSSDLSCRKLQDCLYLIAMALFSPAMTDNVPHVSKEGCHTAACKHRIYDSYFLNGDFREVSVQTKRKLYK